MPSSRRQLSRFIPQLETLGDRIVPAGVVTTTFLNKVLTISGDGASQNIAILGAATGHVSISQQDGETIVGKNMPNLTYMVTFESLAAREKIWGDFGKDPEWQKLRAEPELADALIVSNISNAILRPLAFSAVR